MHVQESRSIEPHPWLPISRKENHNQAPFSYSGRKEPTVNTNKTLTGSNAYKKRSRRKITFVLVIANLVVLTFLGSWSSGKPRTLDQKSKGKVVSRHFALKNEPIEIAKVTVKAKDIRLDEDFEEEADWLKYLVFHVKNKSDKAIIFMQIDLDFPDTRKETGAIGVRQLLFGQRPDFASTFSNPILYLPPNEMTKISLEPEYGAIKKLIAQGQQPIENIKKVVIRTGEALFEDGTRYSGGYLYTRNPDPNSTKKWIRIP